MIKQNQDSKAYNKTIPYYQLKNWRKEKESIDNLVDTS